jgi:hypothetical protein
MIRSNIGLGIYHVNKYLAYLPEYKHTRDDLISAAILGLSEGVAKMIEQGPVENPKPTGLLTLYIQCQVGKTLETEHNIRVPRASRKRNKIQNPVMYPLPDSESSELSYDPTPLRDLRAQIDACCEDEIDRQIVVLREEGYVDEDIALRLDLPRTTAYVRRRMIYSRFLELTGWKGQP